MTTFTLQDLTPAQQEAVEQHEAMLSAYSILNTRSINNLPTTPEEDEAMQALSEKQFVEHGMNNPISANAIEYATQHAPEPQPSQVNPEAVIDEMLYTIKQSLLLLSTVISQPKAQPEVGTNVPSLQETVALVLQQSDWFKDIIKEEIESRVESEVIPWLERRVDFNDAGEKSLQECVDTTLQQADWFKDMVKDEVESRVESEVESYFERRFDPTDHFDFGDAVSNEVSDQIDDVVRDRLDEVVQEQLEEVVAERLKSIRVVFD